MGKIDIEKLNVEQAAKKTIEFLTSEEGRKSILESLEYVKKNSISEELSKARIIDYNDINKPRYLNKPMFLEDEIDMF